MLLVQNIKVSWNKECRGGEGAIQRSKMKQAAMLPKNFFEYVPFGQPYHYLYLLQDKEGIHTEREHRLILKEKQDNVRFICGPIEIFQESGQMGVSVRSTSTCQSNFHSQQELLRGDVLKSAMQTFLTPENARTAFSPWISVHYRYDLHHGAIPPRYQYDSAGTLMPLNEEAFILHMGEYGRVVCNGRFVDIDTGEWWYEMEIVNIRIMPEASKHLDCFLSEEPTYIYKQIEFLR